MLSLTSTSAGFRAIVDEAAASLHRVDYSGEAAYLKTAGLYPSGSSVVVCITPDRGGFLVSDLGQGQVEADMMGGASTFARTAPHVAERAGVGFDHRAFFLVRVDRSRLPGAIATVATCSMEAVQLTAQKLSEKRHEDATDRLYRRLVNVFTRARVTRDAEVLGASTTTWPVATLVSVNQHQAIFEPVTANHISIASAVTKFYDISQLEDAPGRVAVVRRKAALGTKLGVLSAAARVIEEDAPDSVLEQLAAAA
ncbi:MAG: hypothetical protein RIC54_05350 [Thalassobaculum sp.]|uniref:hypothetical protein n=1 Tax=Thalassobaculum sp. TaxID=2022740 RepID=UPI0032EE4152